MHALGEKKLNSGLKAEITDRFRIGSNTKTITSYLAFQLVKKGKIKWETKFFELYPELKEKSNPSFYDITLKDLITFRANLPKWSYGNEIPDQNEIKGNEQQQRYAFIKWELQQKEPEKQDFYFSNPDYVAAGLMLEKASGKDYKTLVKELGKELGIRFEFGQPNSKDPKQPWGHDDQLIPEKPGDNYKLNWLLPAGNINVNLPDYIKFVQMQLKGLAGNSKVLGKEQFNEMHFGLPGFSYGWFWNTDEENHLTYSYHEGTPGTFLSEVLICKERDKAIIIFSNVQSDDAFNGLKILYDELDKRFIKGCLNCP
jgi:CubicO group peptidase (beta-lactamase class C family)